MNSHKVMLSNIIKFTSRPTAYVLSGDLLFNAELEDLTFYVCNILV